MVWMRLAGFSSFKKLWGIIEENLPQDKYTIIIQNNYQTSSASSEYHRGITITTLNDLGGRNYEVGILLIVFGLLSLFAMIFLVITWRVKVKKTKES